MEVRPSYTHVTGALYTRLNIGRGVPGRNAQMTIIERLKTKLPSLLSKISIVKERHGKFQDNKQKIMKNLIFYNQGFQIKFQQK